MTWIFGHSVASAVNKQQVHHCRLMEAVLLILNRMNLNSGHAAGHLSLLMVGQLHHMRIYLTKRERKKNNTG